MDLIVIDSGPDFADRYTAVIDEDYENALAMSDDPFHPQGVGMHVQCDPDWVEACVEAGQEVGFDDLPEKVQKCIGQEMEK